ncbi:MAG: 30S ribosomal protein S18 [Acidimicrobiaceae bacterium]|jgi:small subunit ribosomal protein S18|nr:30S ribosomal protein S18 [Acidimicrobiaceae bacterium]MBT5579866.1 30S ribosomal protein S18 [Acidimicrobiaceae bacterium]MBT5851495.1 30S ribosomal protein S18 [Acidimicrobiaceae bacterium]
MPKAKPQRGKSSKNDNRKGGKKKVSILTQEKIDYVDWKDANLVRRFVSERSKIRARRVTGNSAQQQKLCADAVKVAREMALVPYATRVTSQRSNRGDRDRGRAAGPAPRPSGPPPAGEEGEEGEETVDTAVQDNAEAVAEVEGVEFNAESSED